MMRKNHINHFCCSVLFVGICQSAGAVPLVSAAPEGHVKLVKDSDATRVYCDVDHGKAAVWASRYGLHSFFQLSQVSIQADAIKFRLAFSFGKCVGGDNFQYQTMSPFSGANFRHVTDLGPNGEGIETEVDVEIQKVQLRGRIYEVVRKPDTLAMSTVYSHDFKASDAGDQALDIEITDPAALQKIFRHRYIDFNVMKTIRSVKVVEEGEKPVEQTMDSDFGVFRLSLYRINDKWFGGF